MNNKSLAVSLVNKVCCLNKDELFFSGCDEVIIRHGSSAFLSELEHTEYLLTDGDRITIHGVEVVGWNTRVIFRFIDTYIGRTYKKPESGQWGFVDLKNETINVASSDLEYFRPLVARP